MKILTIVNIDKKRRCAVFNSQDKVMRPVANQDEHGRTSQVVVEGDLIFMTHRPNDVIISYTWSDDKLINADVDTKFIPNVINDYLLDWTIETLPASGQWDGINDVRSIALQYGLDKLLIGVNDDDILSGIMNITSNPMEPATGRFNTTLFDHNVVTVADHNKFGHKLGSLLKNLDNNHKEWLLNKKPILTKSSINWSRARKLPKQFSVSCIVKPDGSYRYNELVLFKKDKEPEVINVFDLMNTFKLSGNNFLTLPCIMDEDVLRVIYVLHDDNLTADNKAIIWAYRNR